MSDYKILCSLPIQITLVQAVMTVISISSYTLKFDAKVTTINDKNK